MKKGTCRLLIITMSLVTTTTTAAATDTKQPSDDHHHNQHPKDGNNNTNEDQSLKQRTFAPTNTGNTHSNSSASSYYSYPFSKFALPECATQQVCNAVYKRLNRIHSLCVCPDKYDNPCSISFKSTDEHTIELLTDTSKEALTLVKTCETTVAIRACRGPQDWSILALQNIRTGKSHYLVTCRCLNGGILEGPVAHENPPYAKIPGIRVYGMVCNQAYKKRQARSLPLGLSDDYSPSHLSTVRKLARKFRWK